MATTAPVTTAAAPMAATASVITAAVVTTIMPAVVAVGVIGARVIIVGIAEGKTQAEARITPVSTIIGPVSAVIAAAVIWVPIISVGGLRIWYDLQS